MLTVRTYKISFFKRKEERDEKGNVLDKSYSHLGTITIDDSNTSDTLPLATKAFRSSSPVCQLADKLIFEEVR